MATKPPKAKIVKMHKLLDEALGLWPDVRVWVQSTQDDWLVPSDVEDDLQYLTVVFRRLRHAVEP